MNLLQTILAFLFALGSLVIIHELGHYWVARWCGVKVLRFSVGMGKVIYSRRVGPDQTEWAISILPLGGYVKMLDKRENPDMVLSPAEQQREFTQQSVWRRMAIVVAGPVANFLMAIAIFTGLYLYGVPEPAPKLRAPAEQSAAFKAGLRGGETIVAVNGEPIQVWSDLRWKLVNLVVEKAPARLEVQRASETVIGGNVLSTISLNLDHLGTDALETDFVSDLGLELARPKAKLGKIDANGAGARAGLQPGDVIEAIDGKPVIDGVALIEFVRAAPERRLQMSVLRNGASLSIPVTPAAISKDGKTFGQIKVEIPLGVEMVVVRSSLSTALSKAVVRTWDSSVLQLKVIGKILTGNASVKNITGPITIADYAGQTARLGIITYLGFIAAISIGLGVMNLLPVPVLDGGLLLYYSVEVLTGKPVSERISQLGQKVGVGLLMSLMAVAFFNDIVRQLS